MKFSITEWSPEKARKVRIILFIIRCILIIDLPCPGLFFLDLKHGEITSQKALQIAIVWSLVFLIYLFFELSVRLSTRKIVKERVFLKLLIFFAVTSPIYFICFVFTPIVNIPLYVDPTMMNQNVHPIAKGLQCFTTDLRYFTWPYTTFLLYETVLAIVISLINRRTFPKTKRGEQATHEDGSSV